MNKLIAITCCLVLCASLAGAAVLTYTDSVPLALTNWASSVSIPRFNPALGTLTRVTTTLGAHVEGIQKFESRDAEPTTVTTKLCATVQLTRPDGTVLASVDPESITVDNVTAFDGVVDYGGTSGRTITALAADESSSMTAPPPASDLSLFTGTGNISLPVTATGASKVTGPGNLSARFTTIASAQVTVVYEYSPALASIGDRVWFDSNANGVQDEGELGVADVTVVLCDGNDNTLQATSTDENGFYLFDNLQPGDYYVWFFAPGYGFTPMDASSDDTIDSDATPFGPTMGMTAVTHLDYGENDTSWDAGLIYYGALGDTVWLDSDGDGVYEPEVGEVGIAGVKLNLQADLNGDGIVDLTASAYTNGNGVYGFDNLLPGRYSVCVDPATIPAGYAETYDLNGPLDNCALIDLGLGDVNLNLDFGYRPSPPPGPPPPGSGTGTPGYWKNHPDAWPVDSITIGGVTYSKARAILLLGTAEKGDKTYTMFRDVVCAKLNVGVGNLSSCIENEIELGDQWMALYGPVGSGVKGSSSAWRAGEWIATKLDDYNNGKLCAPHRD